MHVHIGGEQAAFVLDIISVLTVKTSFRIEGKRDIDIFSREYIVSHVRRDLVLDRDEAVKR